MKFIRFAAAAVLAFGSLFAIASPASAHDELVNASPTAGSTVDAGDITIVLEFTEAPMIAQDAPTATIEVTHEGQTLAADAGCMTITDENVISQHIVANQNGKYTVNWRVVSDDGHPVTGSYDFNVTGGDDGNTDGATCAMEMMAMEKGATGTGTNVADDQATSYPFGISPLAGLGIGFVVILIISTISALRFRKTQEAQAKKDANR